ncbi:hypothetical protein A0J61_11118 [Choanephora cucurbitarum]|uniref:Uncharacterized protein n=1 Tax=Choanephora cucurbitarum TaxID=101091 RepID=A0A1C7MVG9_9FUNG|nr:hypothetical protein A0J61_11118 [Choanephora cucurbitarum]
MWSPLIEKLFRRDGLRTKWGESMGEDTADKATGIKVDLRLVKDTLARRKKEASKANVEVAKFGASPMKITGDSSKLFVESKIVIDNLAKEEHKKINRIIVPSLQIVGNKITLFSVALEANGVYVAVREGSAFIPSHVSHTKEFKRVIKLLLKFKAATMDLMAFGLDGEDEYSSNSNSNNNNNSSNSNKSNSRNSNSNISWLRGTWVPPTGEKKRLPALPEQLFFCK